MKRLFQFKKIRTRYSFWFVLIAMLPLLISTSIIYKQRVNIIKTTQFQKLIGIRDLKVREINSWLDGREGDLHVISGDQEIIDYTKKTFLDSEELKGQQLQKSAGQLLQRYLDNYSAYYELFLISSASGKVILSTDQSSVGDDKGKDAFFTEALESKGLFIKDIYQSGSKGKRPEMTFSIPILCNIHEVSHPVGVLVARIDLENSLYNLLLNRTGMGQTGETLIVNKAEMALNELRHYENAPLRLHISADPAVNAAAGKTGILESNDYRGEPVLAAYTNITRTGWGFVAKQDQKEVYVPINQMLINMLVIILISAIGVYLFSYFISRTTVRPIMEMVDVAKRIGKKDYSARVNVQSNDETAILAKYINQSTESTELQLYLSEGLALITNTFVNATTLGDLGKSLIQELLKLTDSQLAGLHILDSETGHFEPQYSIGFQHDKLVGFNASVFEGEFGTALSTKQISRSSEIPDDTVYLFKTLTGNALPKEIVNIPIIINYEVQAIISLGSLSIYSPKALELIQNSWIAMNTGFANMLAEGEVRRIADELGEKNQELESLAEEFKAQADELQEQNVELDEQRQHVESANVLKSEFLSNMSHELRTPLNSILSLTGVLKKQTVDKISAEETSYLGVVERNGKVLLELINDILDLSKIEAGQMDLHQSPVSISGIVTDMVEGLEPIAKDKGVSLILDLPDNFPQITSDEFMIHRILQNLLSNAVKFTEQGEVLVKIQSNNGTISIAVKDTGIGIPADSLALIFEEFRQVDGSTSRKFEGTGLGLAIAKRSALMLGGDIQVESVENEGSSFTLILPTEMPGTSDNGDMNIPSHPTEPKISETMPSSYAKDLTLLIVEDQEPAILLLSSFLKQAGFSADIARGGQEAIDYCNQSIPDGIILDLMMPGVDGFQVLESIRSRPETNKIPVLILTAKDLTKNDLNRLSANNVQQLVQKGDIDKLKFLHKIGTMLGVKRESPLILEHKAKALTAQMVRTISSSTPDRLTVLILEDNPDNMLSMKAILPDEYSILEATDGVTGLEMIRAQKPDLVLMDIMLPGMDGVAVIKQVRNDKTIAGIPVMVVTAKAMKGDKESFLAAGFDSYISKPIDPNDLIKKIQSFLKA